MDTPHHNPRRSRKAANRPHLPLRDLLAAVANARQTRLQLVCRQLDMEASRVRPAGDLALRIQLVEPVAIDPHRRRRSHRARARRAGRHHPAGRSPPSRDADRPGRRPGARLLRRPVRRNRRAPERRQDGRRHQRGAAICPRARRTKSPTGGGGCTASFAMRPAGDLPWRVARLRAESRADAGVEFFANRARFDNKRGEIDAVFARRFKTPVAEPGPSRS